MLFNIHTMAWDPELLRLFRVPESMLPEVRPSSGIFGYTSEHLFGERIPIAGVAGDQQAALFGQCCFGKGDVKNTYGTGGFLLMNTGEKPVDSAHGLLTTVGWQLGGRTTYVLEGSVFVCGAVIQWLRDGLRLFAHASDTERMALSVPDSAGIYLVPAFVGLGAPYWDPFARGSVQGLTRAATAEHLVRAALESMAYQTADVLSAMEQDAAAPIRTSGWTAARRRTTFCSSFRATSSVSRSPVRAVWKPPPKAPQASPHWQSGTMRIPGNWKQPGRPTVPLRQPCWTPNAGISSPAGTAPSTAPAPGSGSNPMAQS